MRSLIERHGGVATVAASMREVPLEDNHEAFAFAEQLFAGRFDLVIFMTGVGARGLLEVLETRYPREQFFEALARCEIIVRGPKPASVLREWKVPFQHQVPEPNTWRELLTLLDEKSPVAGRSVAIQEYGKPNEELYAALRERGAEVHPVQVYRWALPEETGPLEEAIRSTIAGDFDVLLFTSANQLTNVLDVAERLGCRDEWLAAARRCVIASIGPTASETLEAAGLPVDLVPEHPKMGHLIREAAAAAHRLLDKKRAAQ